MTPEQEEIKCPKCGDKVYIIKGLFSERDGIREDRWCDRCFIIYKSTAAGLFKRGQLK